MVVRAQRPAQTATPTGTATQATAAPRVRARILIIEARYYEKVSDELAAGAIAELESRGATFDRVVVPGALEIPQALAQAAANGLIPMTATSARYNGAIVLGCVIRGETAHYDIVCNNANHWLYEIATRHNIPIGNGILTVDTEKQAMARAKGGKEGKGGDAARACLRLVEIARTFAGQGA